MKMLARLNKAHISVNYKHFLFSILMEFSRALMKTIGNYAFSQNRQSSQHQIFNRTVNLTTTYYFLFRKKFCTDKH